VYASGTTANVRIIEKNIILNGVGNYAGTNGTIPYAEGVYLDESGSSVVVKGNTVAGNAFAGIKLHKAHDNNIRENISFNNGWTGIYLQNSVASNTIYNNKIDSNQFVAKASAQLAMRFFSPLYNGITTFGTADSNYYARPIDDDYTIYNSQPSTGEVYRTLSSTNSWKTYSSQDVHSSQSPIAVADTTEIDFYYNATNAPVIKVLPYASIDLAGTKYAANYTVPAWYSVVLLKDPAPSPPPTQPLVTTNVSWTYWSRGAIGGGNCTDDGGGTGVIAKGVCYNTTGSPTIADSHTHDGTGEGTFTSRLTLLPSTTYYIRAYATNEDGDGYGYDVSFTTPVRSFVTSGGKVVTSGGKIVVIN
jgi:parallel beta-helix repeat protein